MRFHIHWYKLIEDDNNYNWSGIVCRRRIWKCRFCSAKHTSMSGTA